MQEKERASKEEEEVGGGVPILEHCSSCGLPEVLGEEKGEMENKNLKRRADMGLDRDQSIFQSTRLANQSL